MFNKFIIYIHRNYYFHFIVMRKTVCSESRIPSNYNNGYLKVKKMANDSDKNILKPKTDEKKESKSNTNDNKNKKQTSGQTLQFNPYGYPKTTENVDGIQDKTKENTSKKNKNPNENTNSANNPSDSKQSKNDKQTKNEKEDKKSGQ